MVEESSTGWTEASVDVGEASAGLGEAPIGLADGSVRPADGSAVAVDAPTESEEVPAETGLGKVLFAGQADVSARLREASVGLVGAPIRLADVLVEPIDVFIRLIEERMDGTMEVGLAGASSIG